jgi:hypothetical protein
MEPNPHPQLQSFTLFPDLPVELRLKVWAYTIPPRIVTLHSQGKHDEPRLIRNSEVVYCGKAMWWTSPNPIPTILHICHESREEALKSYCRLFKPNDFQAAIYFDFSRDTLRIGITRPEYYLTEGNSWFSGGRDPCMEDHTAIVDWPENHEINIAENLQFMITEDDDFSPSVWHQIRRFPALRELTVMPWENLHSMDRWMKLHRAWIRSIAQKYPEWSVPKITVISAGSGTGLGTLTVQDEGEKSEGA